MLKQLKSYVQRFRAETSLSETLNFFSFVVGIAALILVYFQLLENTNTNKVSIRGQLPAGKKLQERVSTANAR